ncbi:MAG: ROK family transcriptional regulator [Terriglobia bacterium]
MKKHPVVEARLEEILKEITQRDEISVSHLAQALGVKLSTAQQKIRPLLREGLVCFNNQGRKIALNPDFGCVVGIDLGASHLHFALANFRGEILNDFTEKIRPEDGPEKLITQIKEGIRRQVDAMTRKRLSEKPGRAIEKKIQHSFTVRGLAIGVPSPVDPVSGIVSLANNLPGWKNIHLARALEKQFRVPVIIENDANMAAIGEHWRGVARGVNNFVFIALGTGIGAGVFVDGKLVRGRTGSAGELFRMNVEWQRWDEDFGNVGYFETHVSGMGIAAEGRKLLGPAAAAEPRNLAAQRDAYFVFESLRQGNPKARIALEKVFTMLGVGIANIVAVLDPDLIVLGGGVVKGAPELLLATLDRVVHRIQKEITPSIQISTLDDKAQTHGAVFSALAGAQKAILLLVV